MSIRSKAKDVEFVGKGCTHPFVLFFFFLWVILCLIAEAWKWFVGLFNFIFLF